MSKPAWRGHLSGVPATPASFFPPAPLSPQTSSAEERVRRAPGHAPSKPGAGRRSLAGLLRLAEGAAVVVGPAPPPPPHLGHPRGRPLTGRARLLVVPRRLGAVPGLRPGGRAVGTRPEPLPGAALARPLPLGATGRA